jgi:hypothetical protein
LDKLIICVNIYEAKSNYDIILKNVATTDAYDGGIDKSPDLFNRGNK